MSLFARTGPAGQALSPLYHEGKGDLGESGGNPADLLRNYIHRIIMEATVNKIQVNVMTVANAVVVKETTYQKLKRLSKKYNLQTNDPKFTRV